MLDGIKMYKKTILRFFLQLKRPEYLIYAPFETIYHTVHFPVFFTQKNTQCTFCQNLNEFLTIFQIHLSVVWF